MRKFLASLSLLMLPACSAVESTGPVEGERSPLGKADGFGSCADGESDHCGGQSDGNCWCDDACAFYGDCCADKAEVCDGPATCLASSECGDAEYCHFADECGEGPVGTCEVRPDACIELIDWVCGCDGVSYVNSCFAAMAGVSVQADGQCDAPPPPPPPPPSCEDNCGGAADGCYCDDLCEAYGDCCDDYEEICVAPEPVTCDDIVEDFFAETAAIRSCNADAECGQVLTGTSCGCTRNWVARTDADIGDWEALRQQANDNACQIPGGISTCDCPFADGFACVQGTCTWNYL